jgi:hypothetical protein
MSPALTLLIASSVGWTAPETRPARLEIDLLVAVAETAVLEEASAPETRSPDAPAGSPASSRRTASRARSERAPSSADARAAITYDLALPWIRTKP